MKADNKESPRGKTERCMIIALFVSGENEREISAILNETELLTQSAGGWVVKSIYQKRTKADPRYLIGKGKATETCRMVEELDLDTLIVYNSLSNVQQRNLEILFGIKVIDRTRLILDVFASRARSLEGKLQVELAQLLYLLPRLTGRGVELSRLGGGIGTRGPGETKLEVDRRRIQKRIAVIKRKLKQVIKNREVQRRQRGQFPVPVITLVGYTSAGKSTLFRTLTGEAAFVSSQLFSTLDPLLRRLDLSDISPGYYCLLADTVGFIRDMPEELYRAFRATLEEMVQSDFVIHVVDISREDYREQRAQVERVLDSIGIMQPRVITVYNKIDLIQADPDEEGGLPDRFQPGAGSSDPVFVSAKTGSGIQELKRAIVSHYFHDYESYSLSFPVGVITPDTVSRWALILEKSVVDGMMSMDIVCSRQKMIQFKKTYGGYVK